MANRPIDHHRQLVVWQRGMELLVATYALTRGLPREELFGLTSQLRRAAVSIPANIAEGHARAHRGDFVHHLSIARGSVAEVETLLDACQRLGYADGASVADALGLADEVRRMLGAMVVRLRDKPSSEREG